jgi:hypothetical protein
MDPSEQYYLEFLGDKDQMDELPTIALKRDMFGKYSLFEGANIIEIKKRMLCLEHFEKPLKSVSTYKLDELVDISKRLGCYNEAKHLKKTELYKEITDIIQWKK